uniref:Right handed beta helix domain-containing protein n=1 Tax=gamma proteobacterium D250 TaxID=649546 RepID=M4HX53_9GAMM|nr:hypothetical protein [gamma proteobacterium D250]AFT64160.1 hypothetical protein [gamma proteobacterium D250]
MWIPISSVAYEVKLEFNQEVEDYCPIVNQHINSAVESGGGVIEFGPGRFPIKCSIRLDSNIAILGSGRGITIIDLQSPVNAFISRDFTDFYSGGGDLKDAPKYLSVKNLTIEGNYLSSSWKSSDSAVVNDSGSGIVLFGSLYEIDVEINNIPGHALFLAGFGERGTSDVRSIVRLNGRVSGGAAINFKGPGDIVFENVIYGLTNADPISGLTGEVSSAAFVINGLDQYEGNVELGFVHVYANYFGPGIQTFGNVRLEGAHIVSESNASGVKLSEDTYGSISLLSVRNNGRHHPNYSGSYTAGPGLVVDSQYGFSIGQYTCFRTVIINYDDGWPCAQVNGNYIKMDILSRNTTSPETGERYEGDGVVLKGDKNYITGRILNIHGDYSAIIDNGEGNYVNVIE